MTLFAVLISSCNPKDIEVKHVQTATPMENLKNIAVVNAEDPVCKMKTADHLKFTAEYNGKRYGFCSLSCKNQFMKNPEKFLK